MADMVWVKQNMEPISIEWVPREDGSCKLYPDFVPSFWFEDERHYLDEYIRCHDNVWVGDGNFPEFIHGFDGFDYSDYVKFVEIVDDDHVNVWRNVRGEEDCIS